MKKIIIFQCLILLLCFSTNLLADKAKVLDVEVINSNGSYGFNVKVIHNDTGWKHYANKWEIVGEDGTVLATRILHHPHVNEQPFTRSLGGVNIPEHVKAVTVRAHDLLHGHGDESDLVELK